jgi:hypothetical protein
MKKLFATLAENTQKQLREQGEKHAMEIAAMKRANLDTQNVLTTKTMSAQTMNDHRTTGRFTAITKPSETLFNWTPENWPAFEHHLLKEGETPTIRWNQEITNYQPTDKTSEPFNLLERYFDLPDNMTGTLMNDLADAKIVNLVSPASQLYKLHCLKTKLKNCLMFGPSTWHRSINSNWPQQQRWAHLIHQTRLTHLPRQGIPQMHHLWIHPQTGNNRI